MVQIFRAPAAREVQNRVLYHACIHSQSTVSAAGENLIIFGRCFATENYIFRFKIEKISASGGKINYKNPPC